MATNQTKSTQIQPNPTAVSLSNLITSWQKIDSGAKVGVMRGMEFGEGGRAARLINSSAYHRATTTGHR